MQACHKPPVTRRGRSRWGSAPGGRPNRHTDQWSLPGAGTAAVAPTITPAACCSPRVPTNWVTKVSTRSDLPALMSALHQRFSLRNRATRGASRRRIPQDSRASRDRVHGSHGSARASPTWQSASPGGRSSGRRNRLPGLPRSLEELRSGDPHTRRGEGRVRQAAVIEERQNYRSQATCCVA